ncbi:MAG: 4Fe-4S binding protein [Rhodospirillaceae bacterium]|nr:4Fe-4S binding protein [Rhodospirillales bacterium]
MKVGGKRVLVCSCEGTMPVDGKAVAAALGAEPPQVFHQLCRAQLAAYGDALASGESLMVACRQEAPLFAELAEEVGRDSPIFVDIRDRAGWSDSAAKAAPKMAALIAEAALALEPTPVVTLASSGRILVLGKDDVALEAARRLADERAVQVLLTGRVDGLVPPSPRGFTLWCGKPVRAVGALGNWTVTVTGLAGASPSSRGQLTFEQAQDQASLLSTDVVLDLTGDTPLISRRDGWIAADPRVPAQVERAISEAHGLMGEFEKPRYILVDSALCAHSRNGRIACTRCMDACPSSAIMGKGDIAVIDPHACGGHGACASACPTGAIRYEFPANNGVFKRLGEVLRIYRAGGGSQPVLLVHDAEHGDRVISALARFGAGLPSQVLPFAVNAVAALGVDFLLTAVAQGAARVVVLADPERKVDLAPMQQAAALADRVLDGLGWGARMTHLTATDPAELAAVLAQPAVKAVEPAAEFLVLGGKRQTLHLALAHLSRNAPTPLDVLALEAGDPFGAVVLDADKCTLCLACIGVCPANALSGHPDKPSLGFLEANCVQCGLCKVTCPEKAISLTPRLNFTDAARSRQVLKEEEPYCCTRCGKAFGTKSSIEKLVERLSGHSMFAGTDRIELIKMCEDCRVVAQYEGESGTRPMAQGVVPVPRTADDYK